MAAWSFLGDYRIEKQLMNQKVNRSLIFVRLDSKRLPRKALRKIGKYALLEWVIKRVQKSKYFEPTLLTSDRQIDDPLVDIAKKNGISYYRGDLEVSKRTYNCIMDLGIKSFARVNGDSPFVDWELLDEGFELFKAKNTDFVSNLIPRTYPYGISVEVINTDSFINNYNEIQHNELYREHITSFFYDHIEDINFSKMPSMETNNSNLQFTVDTSTDLERLRKLNEQNPNMIEMRYNEIIKLF